MSQIDEQTELLAAENHLSCQWLCRLTAAPTARVNLTIAPIVWRHGAYNKTKTK